MESCRWSYLASSEVCIDNTWLCWRSNPTRELDVLLILNYESDVQWLGIDKFNLICSTCNNGLLNNWLIITNWYVILRCAHSSNCAKESNRRHGFRWWRRIGKSTQVAINDAWDTDWPNDQVVTRDMWNSSLMTDEQRTMNRSESIDNNESINFQLDR